MPNPIDISGMKFGRLSVIGRAAQGKHGARWMCLCDCGKTIITRSDRLRSGQSKSCGCYHRHIKTKHGRYSTPAYVSWSAMKRRCLNPRASNYSNYGGREIHIYLPWMDFNNFYNDMGDRPKGTSLERIDNEGNYHPDNCRWATGRDQRINQRKKSSKR